MKIYDASGNAVGTIDKPAPVESGGEWWEPIEFRLPKKGEHIFIANGILLTAFNSDLVAYWIMREIPRATPEQLQAIGMRERDGRPVLLQFDDQYWAGEDIGGKLYWCQHNYEIYRWVLEPVPRVVPVDSLASDAFTLASLQYPEDEEPVDKPGDSFEKQIGFQMREATGNKPTAAPCTSCFFYELFQGKCSAPQWECIKNSYYRPKDKPAAPKIHGDDCLFNSTRECVSCPNNPLLGRAAPKQEPVTHTSCAGCKHSNMDEPCPFLECFRAPAEPRLNYTPSTKQEPPHTSCKGCARENVAGARECAFCNWETHDWFTPARPAETPSCDTCGIKNCNDEYDKGKNPCSRYILRPAVEVQEWIKHILMNDTVQHEP